MNKNITETYELLSNEEWDKYLSTNIYDKMMINGDIIKCSDDILSKMVFSKILSIIQAHNNKVGSIKISYALAMHYFDKGIPDDEWFISPGKNGSSIDYMPHFNDEDYLIRYWYCFFMENLYGKVQSMCDTLYLFINEFYELGIKESTGFVSKVLNRIKTTNPALFELLNNSHKDKRYLKASNFRNNIVHGISPNEIKNEIILQRNTETVIKKADENGNAVDKKVIASIQVEGRVGDYVTSKELLNCLTDFADYIGDIISQAISIISEDVFTVNI
ncbi:MAG: hypothetical protein E7497_01050 [Ruminococcus sp.]|nr:hypothetical protein [Ruminococcus sp.]